MTDKGSVNEQGSNSTIHSSFEVEIPESRSDAKDDAKGKRAINMTSNCHNNKRTSEPAKQKDCFEIPFYMIDRNSLDRQGASTSSLFDLSNFEMFNGKSSVDEIVKKVPEVFTMEKSPQSDVNPVQPQTTVTNNCMEEECHIIDEVAVGKDGKNIGDCIDVTDFEVRNDVSDLEMPERNYNAEIAEEVPLATDEVSGFGDISKQLPTMNDQIKPLLSTSTAGCCDIEMENLEISNAVTTEQVPLATNEISGFSNISKQLPTMNDQIKPLPSTPTMDCCDVEMENLEISNAVTAEQLPLATNEISGFSNISKQLPTCYDPIKQLPTMSTVEFCEIETENLEISNGTLEKEQNGVCSEIDPVLLQREFTPHESSGRVTQILGVKPVSCKNPFTMQAKDNKAGKVPEVAEKVQDMMVKEKNGELPVIVKLEPEDRFDFSLGIDEKACDVVKTENIDFSPLSPPRSVNFFCSVPVETHSFLELPVHLPVYSCKGRRLNSDRRIVVLRDPAMRKWPVLYHERSQFRVLAKGWEALAKANSIQPGHICNLKLENLSEHLFQLSVERN